MLVEVVPLDVDVDPLLDVLVDVDVLPEPFDAPPTPPELVDPEGAPLEVDAPPFPWLPLEVKPPFPPLSPFVLPAEQAAARAETVKT